MFKIASLAALMMIAASLLAPVYAVAADTVEMTPSSAATDLSSARALVEARKYDEALPALRQLDQQSPNNPDVLNLIGFSLRKTGKMDEALGYYQRALALSPRHLGANEYLGELYLETNQPQKAKERLEVLRQACSNCEEFQDLQKQIAQYAAR